MYSFWSKVSIDNPFLCWMWNGAKSSNKYGNFRSKCAHRVSYSLVIGSVSDDLELDHLCKNKLCVNPYHLEPVSHKENITRSVNKKFCKNGHPRVNLYGNRCRECRRLCDKRR